ncbi:TPA: hypothetical protein ACV406_003004 [Salmonella enterica]|nr:hypothetical protein [Salmonella enterica]EDH8282280.1 hypothetical protein [Salmonella enterica subsp. enterica serovar Livingstone]EDP8773820.1 hypothetical protein [Salmonella enterica subsp. enterica serovar Livingstone]EKZ9348705.1 hypothetical protein [Salmonella enterica]HAG4497358.1 hypothetical protein [Salmonella enterica]
MRTTPPHLQPVLSRVKRYVEKMPEGTTLTQLSQKVPAYSQLNKKDKEILIGIIRDSGLLVVTHDGRATTLHHPKFGHKAINIVASAPLVTEEPAVIKKTVTPEELRKQAEELIRAAEEAEKKINDRSEIKKQLDPLRLEVLQSYGMASRKFDEFVDAMADMGKAVQKLKQIVL